MTLTKSQAIETLSFCLQYVDGTGPDNSNAEKYLF